MAIRATPEAICAALDPQPGDVLRREPGPEEPGDGPGDDEDRRGAPAPEVFRER
ncbi:hypothetical protein [Pseudokineococcus sp. 1T1Z-3]|uniref:hypothetical protein n=1 Tax=Pseudokineococcus sp. 1T1Z-3 TaxID=3132745 RepID=UPI0030989D64